MYKRQDAAYADDIQDALAEAAWEDKNDDDGDRRYDEMRDRQGE